MRAGGHRGLKGQFLVRNWAFPEMMLASLVMMLASIQVQDWKGRRRGMEFGSVAQNLCVQAYG